MFRYRDSSNYYRFSMDANLTFRRLIRKSVGSVTVLWEDGVAYVPGRAYFLTIDCVGRRITGYLNGIRLFSLQDGAHAAGRMALYCWGNSAAHFNELLVTPAAWMTYYEFGAEEQRSAGRWIKIFSGSAATAPAAAVTEECRFRATMTDRGRPQLAPDEALMRLVPPAPVAAHQRAFLDGVLFTPVSFTILRKADGTAFVLFAPSGSAPGSRLDEAQYRLRLTYRRDNKSRQPDSQLLSEAGDTSEEVATLDIPWVTRG